VLCADGCNLLLEEMLMTRPVRRALLSVSDKTGLSEFAQSLHALGVTLIGTGGTASTLEAMGIPVTEISRITGAPEILDGRVKTLHPHVHAALLAKPDDPGHSETLRQLGIEPIDLLVVNFYPFEAAVQANTPFAECIENIDIGGPAMIRAAAKNHEAVAIVTDPDDYAHVIHEMRRNLGALSSETRRNLAHKAFSRTAAYDAVVSNWFFGLSKGEMPAYYVTGGRQLQKLRYGENPHQQAAFYSTGASSWGLAAMDQIQGKQLSYNNINDIDAAWQCVMQFPDRPACVIVKHANPCGVALADNLSEAYRRALACDPVSAFGGIVALSQQLDEATAKELVEIFTEVIVAPQVTKAARQIIATKPNLRLVLIPMHAKPDTLSVKSVAGGLLVQSQDDVTLDESNLNVVTRRKPSDAELADLKFAFTVAKHVKSNAIVYARNLATIGIGAGQMSRLDASRTASRKAADAAAALGLSTPLTMGSVAASDAFFPFADALLEVAAAGATAVIQPGGSVRDAEVIAAADNAGLAMVFTGIRHFRH
jgi:phosphoribosylaminoimidazolecarboxamide formyltransferase/IMP cyclohydrolase